MRLWSDSWANGERIPSRYAAGKPDPSTVVTFSDNLNPHLAWSEVPTAAKSFALICHDFDVPSRVAPALRGRWDHGWRMRADVSSDSTRPPSEVFCSHVYADSLAHFDQRAGGVLNGGEDACAGGFDLDNSLVGLDLGDELAWAQRLALRFQPADYFAFADSKVAEGHRYRLAVKVFGCRAR